MNIDEALFKLSKSQFRSSFHLNKNDKDYVVEKGRDVIEQHAKDFVKTKLSPKSPLNDGKQTPTHGHPIFKAMHACACCCRGCLNKWYNVEKGKELTEIQQDKIVNLLMAWVDEEMKK